MSTRDNRFVRLLKSRLEFRPPVENDPRLLKSGLKNFIIVVLALSACMPGFSSTIYFPGIPNINAELNAPPIATTLTAALFVLFMGIAPVFWASFSDFYMIRRFWLIVSMMIFVVSSLGNAFINNIWGMVVLRCVQAIGASSGQAIGGGVIADLYPIEQRGSAYGKFFLGMNIGPILGPIIGGFLIMSVLTWRATFWFCVAFGGVNVLTLFFLLPETFRDEKKWETGALPTTTTQQDDDSGRTTSETVSVSERNASNETEKATIQEPEAEKKKAFNPIRPFLMLRYPHILLASLVSGISFGAMFTTETVIPILYQKHYGFNSWQIGLCFLGAGVGNFIGAVINNLLSDKLLLRARAKRGGRQKVEDRISIHVWPCLAILMPFGILLFGWGIESNMSYWTGIVGFGIQTFAMNQVVTSTSAYLLDAAPGLGASATAAGGFVRMLLACVLTLIASPMVENVGSGYLSVFLAALCWLATALLVINKIYGQRIRRHYGFLQDAERKQ